MATIRPRPRGERGRFLPQPPTMESLFARTKPHPGSDCRDWTGPKTKGGYGTFRGTTVHRVMYTLAVGPIPDGYTVDHVKERGCVSTLCVWPPHLEAVTQRDNLMRGDTLTAARAAQTHCKRGHPFTPENTRAKHGGRECKTCHRDQERRRSRRAKGLPGDGVPRR